MSFALKKLNENKFNIMSIMLNHQYTQEAINNNGLNALKSIDNDRYSLLKNASGMLAVEDQYNFYIARSKLVVIKHDFGMGGDDESDNENWMTSDMNDGMPRAKAIKKWCDQDGESVVILDKYNDPEDFFELVLNPDSQTLNVDLDGRKDYGPSIKKKKEKYVGNEGNELKRKKSGYLLAKIIF
jgi:hypothetical protein